MIKKSFFTVASWEPRFWLGFVRHFEIHRASQVFMFHYTEYAQLSLVNRTRVKEFCDRMGFQLNEVELSFEDPIRTYKTLSLAVSELSKQSATVDITAMPREVIWILLGLLEAQECHLEWIYHRPAKYNSDWLSRDASKPRLVPKMGGVSRLGVPTNLLIITGYDVERTKQVVLFFEPECTYLALQSGEQFENQNKNVTLHKKEFPNTKTSKLFSLDAFSNDQGLANLDIELKAVLEDSNLIMTSLGPKPSAIALYKFQKMHPRTSLAYVPSKAFNPEYSQGISETICGKL